MGRFFMGLGQNHLGKNHLRHSGLYRFKYAENYQHKKCLYNKNLFLYNARVKKGEEYAKEKNH